jgi:outer membrane protein OmpA-like peptidoglycan-associated protein
MVLTSGMGGTTKASRWLGSIPGWVDRNSPERFTSGSHVLATGSSKDILFAFDQYEDPTNKATLEADVAYLKAHPEIRIRIDGYTDNRGDIVYNLVLAQKRADIANQDLIRMGIPAERIVWAVGWGKLYPTCDFDSDECWESNRRAHLRYHW